MVEAVRRAALLASRYQTEVFCSVAHKSATDPVSAIDIAVQVLLAQAVRDCFPGETVIGEETVTSLKDDKLLDQVAQIAHQVDPTINENRVIQLLWEQPVVLNRPFHLIDPLDNTRAYVGEDVGNWCVMWARCDEQGAQMSVIACPGLRIDDSPQGVVAVAVREKGAMWSPIHQPDTRRILRTERRWDIANAQLVFHPFDNPERRIRLLNSLPRQEYFPSRACGPIYLELAAGHFDGKVRFGPTTSKSSLWSYDHVAGMLLVAEAKGRVTDLAGKKIRVAADRALDTNGIVATNGAIHDELIRHIRETA